MDLQPLVCRLEIGLTFFNFRREWRQLWSVGGTVAQLVQRLFGRCRQFLGQNRIRSRDTELSHLEHRGLRTLLARHWSTWIAGGAAVAWRRYAVVVFFLLNIKYMLHYLSANGWTKCDAVTENCNMASLNWFRQMTAV